LGKFHKLEKTTIGQIRTRQNKISTQTEIDGHIGILKMLTG